MRGLSSALLCGALFLSWGCGGGANPDRDRVQGDLRLQGDDFIPLSASDQVRFESGALTGQGKVRAGSSLGQAESSHNMSLDFDLPRGSSMSLIMNADSQLESGIEMYFSRSAQTGQIVMKVRAAGTEVDWSEFFTHFPEGERIVFSVDVHNNHLNYAHLLFWKKRGESTFLDSGEDTEGAPGKGLGPHWGLALDGAKLYRIEKSEPWSDR